MLEIRKKEALCLLPVCEKRRKLFTNGNKRRYDGLRAWRGAVVPLLFPKVFLPPSHRDVTYSPALFVK